MQPSRSGPIAAAVLLVAAAAAGAWWVLSRPEAATTPAPPSPAAPSPATDRVARPEPPQPVSVPFTPRPAPESATAAAHDGRPLLRLPDGTAVPNLNGVTATVEFLWTRGRPYSPIVGMRLARGPDEWDWYEHADGSLSTTVDIWRGDLGRTDPISLVAAPVEGAPVDPRLAQQMFEEGRFGKNPSGAPAGRSPQQGR